jgi:uncharacterized protein
VATIAIFGGTGYAGGAIREEALRRGYTVISVSRERGHLLDQDGLIVHLGNVHDPALVDQVTAEADAVVVAIRAGASEGVRLVDAMGSLTAAAAAHRSRLGIVGGAGTLRVTEDGPRVVDLPDFPDAYKGEALGQADVLTALRETPPDVDWFYVSPAADYGPGDPGEATGRYRVGGDLLLADAEGRSYISRADYATAFVDEIEHPRHQRTRFTVAY